MTECPPAARAAFSLWRARQDEWRHRNDTARRDFVAITDHAAGGKQHCV
jgi:hypothetical protein